MTACCCLSGQEWMGEERGTILMKWKIPLTSSGLDSRQWDSRKQNEMAWIVSFNEGNLPNSTNSATQKALNKLGPAPAPPGNDLYLVAGNFFLLLNRSVHFSWLLHEKICILFPGSLPSAEIHYSCSTPRDTIFDRPQNDKFSLGNAPRAAQHCGKRETDVWETLFNI